MCTNTIEKIVQFSTLEYGGGAEKIAWNLYKAFQIEGYASNLIVGSKQSQDLGVIELDNRSTSEILSKKVNSVIPSSGINRIVGFAIRKLDQLLSYQKTKQYYQGSDTLPFPGIWRLLKDNRFHPDIIHLHNLHGNYFDLRALPRLSARAPVILTLHDAWLLAGHCAHSFNCLRWKTGCGSCPDILIPPGIELDNTAENVRKKREIIKETSPFIITPCQWLMDKVKESGVDQFTSGIQVIPNGVNVSIFCPGRKEDARLSLGLHHKEKIILFAANGIRYNIWKDYHMMREAIDILAQKNEIDTIRFIALGESAPPEKIGNITIEFVPHQRTSESVANYYRAADAYIHAAKADTFPNTIIEAQACGLPVVATAVGGIPEQIVEGRTGFLVPPKDAFQFAEKISFLMSDDGIREQMSAQAALHAQRNFDLATQVRKHLELYHSLG